MKDPLKHPDSRWIQSDGSFNLERVGLKPSPGSNLYHFLLTTSWRNFLALLIGLYLLANFLFAVLYTLQPDCIGGLQGLGLLGTFFFSVETMSTVGYGAMAPQTLYGHSLMVMESVFGFLLTALATGLTFAKFSQVRARVLFSQPVLIHREGAETVLTFRAANERSVQIVDAQVRVSLARDERTPEGQAFRRIYDLKLRRDTSPLFALLWNIYHVIDADSPLYGCTPESLEADRSIVMISLQGLDDALGQVTHSRHAYHWEEVLFNRRFEDVIESNPGGRRRVDYRKFHDTYSAEQKIPWL